MSHETVMKTLARIARFYDERKVGDIGFLGFRRSSDLTRLLACLSILIRDGILVPGSSSFFDMGCADGRVNVLFSYLTSKSVGVELDDWTLEEYPGLRRELDGVLAGEGFPTPPGNIFLFQGDTMEPALHERIHQETGLGFSDFDLFYTYLSMHEEFAGLINRKARKGAFFLVYGLDKVFPRFEGLRLLTTGEPLEGILGIYQKE
jgi:hypothetical protein